MTFGIVPLKESRLQQPLKDVQETVDVIVLGAGMCGLVIAQELLNIKTKSWLLIDKGRSVGGRMATRRIDGQRFDHGAQFFTVRSPVFKQTADEWLRNGITKEWTKGFNHHFHVHADAKHLEDGHSRYVGVGGMNQIAKHLFTSLPSEQILLNEKIIGIQLTKERVQLRCESGREVVARFLVITTPIAQTLDLLKSSDSAKSFEGISTELSGVTYDPCVALMGFFDPKELPLDALPIQSPDAVISFLADNYSKGLSSEKGALTVHLAPEASRGMFTAHDQVVVGFVCHQLKQLFGLKNLSHPRSYEVQRWRYASPQTTLQSQYLEWSGDGPDGPQVFFAGEAFGGAKIEGAFLSGRAVVQRLTLQL